MTEPRLMKRWVYFLLGMIAAGMIVAPIYQHYEGERLKSLCISNLRQIGLGQSQYTRDYDEKWPPGARWSDVLVPYLEGWKYLEAPRSAMQFDRFGCPADKGSRYAMNAHIAATSYSEMDDPSTIPDHFESITHLNNYVDLGESAPIPSRHGGGTAVQFIDGHVRLVKSVDCSFIPEPKIHVDGKAYPVRTLPSPNAPLAANIQALFARGIVNLPATCTVYYFKDTVKMYPPGTRADSHEYMLGLMRKLYPKWKYYRKLAGASQAGPYWVTFEWTTGPISTERLDISKL